MEDKEAKQPEQEEQNPENAAGQPEKPAHKTAHHGAGDKMKELQQQLEDSRNKYLYLLSDFENFKRNAARERMDLIQTAGRDILAALLPVVDDFDRAAKNGALNEGLMLVYQKLQHTLEAKGLKRLETKPGDPFNPDFQEAVAEVPAASEDGKGKIVDILEQGYGLGERIIRYAKVVVGR